MPAFRCISNSGDDAQYSYKKTCTERQNGAIDDEAHEEIMASKFQT